MRRHRSMVTILALAFALALAPASLASAKSHHSTKHNTHKSHTTHKTSTTKEALVPGGSVCTFLDDQAGSSHIAAAMQSAIESGNFASAQSTLLNLFTLIGKDAPTAEEALSSAPANVQAAFKTMISYDAQFKTAVANATSFATLGTALASLGQNSSLQAASTTVGSYATEKCGA
jgi:hypothetical protein